MRARRASLCGVLFMVGALGVSACGSSSKPGAAPRIKASGAAIVDDHHEDASKVCRLVTQPDAEALFGVTARQNTQTSLATVNGACIWIGTAPKVHYTLQAYVYDSTSSFSSTGVAGAAVVKGVGDRAFSDSAGRSLYRIRFVKGDRMVSLTFGASVPGATTPANAVARAAAVIALARRVAARM